MVRLMRGKWKTPPPNGIDMLGLNGLFDPNGGQGAGQISGQMRARPGPRFEAIRDPAESAILASVNADKKAAPPPPPVAAQQARPPGAPKPAAPPPSTSAPNASGPTAVNGVYTGEFKRSDGSTKLKFSIKSTDDGSLTGLFTFEPPAHPGSSVTYKLTGKYVARAHDYGLASSPFQFTAIEPLGSLARETLDASKVKAVHVGITGSGSIVGSLTGFTPESGEFNCGWLNATKDRTESADLDKAMLAQASGESTSAPPAPVVRPVFEGVYNGTYADGAAPATKFKLTLWLQREDRTAAGQLVNTEVAGLLAVFVPEGSGLMPYTAELKGFYGGANRILQVTSGRWEPPPSGVFLVAGLQGQFDPDAAGNDGRQLSGYMYFRTNPKFQATRDEAESAQMDLARLRKHVRPGIDGVFNGTYTRENEPPTKFKLTITHNHDGPSGLAGMATIYLPVDAGTKAYTYDLKGIETAHGEFQLRVYDWETTPPRDFKNFRSMGFNGKVVLNETLTAAQISNIPAPSSMASYYVPHFEATWDTTESADVNGAIAAQKAVGAAEQAAALKAREETVRNAPPKQLASKDLVRKSRAYWEGYQTDMIREVFDGGFGAAIDEDGQFQRVFCTYVEMFSAKCPDCLPANHQTVTVTEKTNRKFDASGILISEDTRTFTIEMDPRFVDKYNQFYAALNSKGAAMRGAVAAMQSGGAERMLHDLLALAQDMQKFFADHGGKSAATRQMNENLVRAIAGEPSLQQSDGKIDGAQAETDKDLPPGRYARFVDGANAYFRERAKAYPVKFGSSSSHDTALCQRLAELYQFGMSREEDYYYANDFAGRFVPIMGPRANCPDPAWPQLHPDVEKAIADVGN